VGILESSKVVGYAGTHLQICTQVKSIHRHRAEIRQPGQPRESRELMVGNFQRFVEILDKPGVSTEHEAWERKFYE
jgi:hypothetical protein